MPVCKMSKALNCLIGFRNITLRHILELNPKRLVELEKEYRFIKNLQPNLFFMV